VASRLKKSESGVAGVWRILRRETKRALQALDSRRAPRGESIHDARKRLKKARAALRLARESLPDNEYRRGIHSEMPHDRSARFVMLKF